MAYGYRIIADQNLVLITGSGTITSDDIRRVVLAMQRDPEWRPSMNMLVDWRQVTEVLFDVTDVKRLVAEAFGPEQMELGTPLGIRAAVVLSTMEHETVPLMYAAYLRESGLQTRIFYRMSQAEEWLRKGGGSPDANE